MLFLFISLQLYCLFQIGAGVVQYIMILTSDVYLCADEVTEEFLKPEIYLDAYNESFTYLEGSLQLRQPIGPETMLEILIEKEVNGNYELFVPVDICDLCKELENADSPFSYYVEAFGLPRECPVEQNEYTVKFLVPDTQGLPINTHNSGRYRAVFNFYQDPTGLCKDKSNRIFQACFMVDFIIEPDV